MTTALARGVVWFAAGQWDRFESRGFQASGHPCSFRACRVGGWGAGPAAKLGNTAGPAGSTRTPWGRTASTPEDLEGRVPYALALHGWGENTRRCRTVMPALLESQTMGGARSIPSDPITWRCDLVTVSTRHP
ncbi:hypothetical protein GCM10023196_048770 [Actinoallomurus vinaceus]|uniref:Uncharacterized protein n=1 Tax=Actinoallomurus vinaceus TaxID=1080074 RepID=A0ABP8UG89_9ACTN